MLTMLFIAELRIDLDLLHSFFRFKINFSEIMVTIPTKSNITKIKHIEVLYNIPSMNMDTLFLKFLCLTINVLKTIQ